MSTSLKANEYHSILFDRLDDAVREDPQITTQQLCQILLNGGYTASGKAARKIVEIWRDERDEQEPSGLGPGGIARIRKEFQKSLEEE